MKRPRHKRLRLFLLPGSLALALFPLLGFLLMKMHPNIEQQHVIELGFLPPSSSSKAYTIIKRPPYKANTVHIGLEYPQQLEEIAQLLKRIKQTSDTSLGVRIHWSDDLPYQTFISLIDVMKQEDYPAYAIEENDLWTYWYVQPPPDTTEMKKLFTFTCGLRFERHKPDFEEWRQAKTKSESTRKAALQLPLAAYTLLVLAVLFRLKRSSPLPEKFKP